MVLTGVGVDATEPIGRLVTTVGICEGVGDWTAWAAVKAMVAARTTAAMMPTVRNVEFFKRPPDIRGPRCPRDDSAYCAPFAAPSMPARVSGWA